MYQLLLVDTDSKQSHYLEITPSISRIIQRCMCLKIDKDKKIYLKAIPLYGKLPVLIIYYSRIKKKSCFSFEFLNTTMVEKTAQNFILFLSFLTITVFYLLQQQFWLSHLYTENTHTQIIFTWIVLHGFLSVPRRNRLEHSKNGSTRY